MALLFKINKASRILLFLKKNIVVVPFLLLFILPFLIVIGLLTSYSNKEIVLKNKAAEPEVKALSRDNLPWKIYKTSQALPDPEFRLEKNKAFLLGADSGVFVSTTMKGVGLVQKLPEKLEVPLVLKAKLLVVSGRVHFSLVDDKGREIYAGEVKAENKWQDLSAEILSQRFAEEEFKLKEIRVYAADQNTSWYTNNVSLVNFGQQQEKTSLSETFAPIPSPYNLRVMLIALNPVENGENLVDHFNLGWSMSASTVEDTLARNIVSDFQHLSHNLINYQVVKKLNISSFPSYLNGFTYDFAKYSQCLTGDPGGVCERQKFLFDHIRWVRDNRICEIADSERIDAIWLIDPTYLTTWENFLIGPQEGFSVNGGFYIIPECQKHYLVNTGNYRGDPSSLHISHIYGHAVEVIMEYYLTPRWPPDGKSRFWENFTQFNLLYSRPAGVDFDLLPQTFCGNVHWPSNGRRHYDDNNRAYKDFSCPNWKNFPSLRGEEEHVNCERWGCDGGNKWETYWLSTLPKYWWSFLLLPDETIRYRRAGAPIPYPTLTPTLTPTSTLTPTVTRRPTPTPTPTTVIKAISGNVFYDCDGFDLNNPQTNKRASTQYAIPPCTALESGTKRCTTGATAEKCQTDRSLPYSLDLYSRSRAGGLTWLTDQGNYRRLNDNCAWIGGACGYPLGTASPATCVAGPRHCSTVGGFAMRTTDDNIFVLNATEYYAIRVKLNVNLCGANQMGVGNWVVTAAYLSNYSDVACVNNLDRQIILCNLDSTGNGITNKCTSLGSYSPNRSAAILISKQFLPAVNFSNLWIGTFRTDDPYR